MQNDPKEDELRHSRYDAALRGPGSAASATPEFRHRQEKSWWSTKPSLGLDASLADWAECNFGAQRCADDLSFRHELSFY